eukprot:4944-Lingulodinium_polyedra.AAC.1
MLMFAQRRGVEVYADQVGGSVVHPVLRAQPAIAPLALLSPRAARGEARCPPRNEASIPASARAAR